MGVTFPLSLQETEAITYHSTSKVQIEKNEWTPPSRVNHIDINYQISEMFKVSQNITTIFSIKW